MWGATLCNTEQVDAQPRKVYFLFLVSLHFDYTIFMNQICRNNFIQTTAQLKVYNIKQWASNFLIFICGHTKLFSAPQRQQQVFTRASYFPCIQ